MIDPVERTGHQVEVVSQTEFVVAAVALLEQVFDPLQVAERDDSTDAASVEREYPLGTARLEVLVSGELLVCHTLCRRVNRCIRPASLHRASSRSPPGEEAAPVKPRERRAWWIPGRGTRPLSLTECRAAAPIPKT